MIGFFKRVWMRRDRRELSGQARSEATSKLRNAARAANRAKDWPEAARLWRRLLDNNGPTEGPWSYICLSRAYRHLGDFEQSRSVLDQVLERYPEKPGISNERAQLVEAQVAYAVREAERAMSRRAWIEAAEHWIFASENADSDSKMSIEEQIIITGSELLKEKLNDKAIEFAGALIQGWGARRSILALRGIALLRSGKWDDARQAWAEYWKRAQEDDSFTRECDLDSLLSNKRGDQFEPIDKLQSASESRLGHANRVCIYTAIFYDYDELRPPLFSAPGIDYICFSDRPRQIDGWKVRVLPPSSDHPVVRNRRIKMLPYDYLPGYDYSIYIDANITLVTDPRMLIRICLEGKAFVGWRHPHRSDIYAECEAILSQFRHEPGPIIDEYRFFKREGVPAHTGMIESAFLWRDHRNPEVRKLMDRWWQHLCEFSRRDQPGLCYLMWKTGIRPEVMPDRVGTTRKNQIYSIRPHSRHVFDIEQEHSERTPLRGIPDASDSTFGLFNQGEKVPQDARSIRRLTWVYREEYRDLASTTMRCFQLSDLASLYFGNALVVACTNEKEIRAAPPSILMLTKAFLLDATVDELDFLKTRGHMLCADFVDIPPRTKLFELIDLFVASSIEQWMYFTREANGKLVQLITHHTDPRIDGIRAQNECCRVGYFGELINARYAQELNGMIDFQSVSTDVPRLGWYSQLADYSVHYAVRNHRAYDGFKPFIKGFTAAKCGANIVVPLAESDARYYLGSAYPYILKDESLESVLEMLEFVHESYGGGEWHEAREFMASMRDRCSQAQVERELKQLLDQCA